MFHMSREIYDKTEELARLIAQGPEFTAMKRAEADGQRDAQLAACVAAYAEKQRLLEAEIGKDEKDFDLIGALTREIDEIGGQMAAIPAYQAMRQARDDYDSLLQGVNDVLRNIIEPDIRCACSGDCASCGGCDQG